MNTRCTCHSFNRQHFTLLRISSRMFLLCCSYQYTVMGLPQTDYSCVRVIMKTPLWVIAGLLTIIVMLMLWPEDDAATTQPGISTPVNQQIPSMSPFGNDDYRLYVDDPPFTRPSPQQRMREIDQARNLNQALCDMEQRIAPEARTGGQLTGPCNYPGVVRR
jgi:hypothetical protein